MTWRLALHEWRRARAGLMYWLLLAVGQLIVAGLLFAQLEAFSRIAPQLNAAGSTLTPTDLVIAPTLGSLLLILLLVAPLLAQGGFAGEQRSGRLPLWLCSPIDTTRLFIARTLGLFLSLLPLLIASALTLALTGLGIDIDVKRLALGIGMLLLCSLWLSVLLIALSTLAEHPAAVMALSYAVVLLLWLLDSLLASDADSTWLALLPHLEPAFGGLLRTGDLGYFVLTGSVLTAIGVYRLARRRGEL
jgi:ABC-type transport system involved in multi-copper enzyme maturation permease subunit